MLTIEAIVQRLDDTVPDVAAGESIFAGTSAVLPSSGKYLTVSDTGGRTPWKTHNNDRYRRPSFQITAYALDYLEAATLADQAYQGVQGSDVQVGDVFFLSIVPRQEPFPMPLLNGYNRVTFNIDTERRG